MGGWPVRALPWLLALAACGESGASGPPLLDPEVSAAIRLARGSDPDAGLAALESALAHLDPWDARSRVEALRWCAHLQAERGRPDEALAQLALALELEPGDAWLHYARAGALRSQGEYERAIAAYERALGLDPRHLKSAQWLGDTFELIGRDAEAEAALSSALALLEEADQAELASWGGDRAAMLRWTLLARARVRDALGNPAGARRDRTRAEALGPGR